MIDITKVKNFDTPTNQLEINKRKERDLTKSKRKIRKESVFELKANI